MKRFACFLTITLALLFLVSHSGCLVTRDGNCPASPFRMDICELANSPFRQESRWPPSVLVSRSDVRGGITFEGLLTGNKYAPGVAMLIIENLSGQESELDALNSLSWSLSICGTVTRRIVPVLYNAYCSPYILKMPKPRLKFGPHQKRAVVLGLTECPSLMWAVKSITVAYRDANCQIMTDPFAIHYDSLGENFPEMEFLDPNECGEPLQPVIEATENIVDRVKLELVILENVCPPTMDNILNGHVLVERCDKNGTPINREWDNKYVYGFAVLLVSNVSAQSVSIADFCEDPWTFLASFNDGTSRSFRLLAPAVRPQYGCIDNKRTIPPGHRVAIILGSKDVIFRLNSIKCIQAFFYDGKSRLESNKMMFDNNS